MLKDDEEYITSIFVTILGFSFCYNIVQVDRFNFFPWTLMCHVTFPIVATRFLKPIRPISFGPNPFQILRILGNSLSPCSMKAFATVIAIEKVACPPL